MSGELRVERVFIMMHINECVINECVINECVRRCIIIWCIRLLDGALEGGSEGVS